MMVYFHYDTFDLAQTSCQVKIPDNNVAKLDIVCD